MNSDDSARRALAAAAAAQTGPSIDTTEKPLPNRTARSLPFGGGCSLLVGLTFVALGGLFALGLWAAGGLSSRFATVDRDQFWMLPCVILFVIGVGVGLARSGVLAWRRDARAKALRARHPDQPWFADSPWDPKGAFEQSSVNAGMVFVVAFVFLVMAPWNFLWGRVFGTGEPIEERLLLGGMLLIPNFFIYLVLKGLFSVVRDRRRFGRAYLAFDPFPFFLGETLAVRVTAKVFGGQEGVVAVLRCLDERVVSRRYRGGKRESVLPYQVYEALQPFPGPFAGEDVPVLFALPAQPPTELLRHPPRYWELEIRGRKKDDTVVFTVPVYSRPGA
jgi:hypothetical protein